MSDLSFEDFVEESTDYLKARIAKAQEQFGISRYERFDHDLAAGRFWWSDLGVPKVEAKLIVVGSLSTETNTWLWGWANRSLKGVEMTEIERVRGFGEQHKMEKLTEQKWIASEKDGWDMTAVSARLLEAEAACCSPSRNGFLFILLTNLRWASRRKA